MSDCSWEFKNGLLIIYDSNLYQKVELTHEEAQKLYKDLEEALKK